MQHLWKGLGLELTFAAAGKRLHGNSSFTSQRCRVTLQDYGSAVVSNGVAFFLKLKVPFFNLWLLRDNILSFQNITARGKYTLDGYDTMAFNQNLYGGNEWDSYFWSHTVALYCMTFVVNFHIS